MKITKVSAPAAIPWMWSLHAAIFFCMASCTAGDNFAKPDLLKWLQATPPEQATPPDQVLSPNGEVSPTAAFVDVSRGMDAAFMARVDKTEIIAASTQKVMEAQQRQLLSLQEENDILSGREAGLVARHIVAASGHAPDDEPTAASKKGNGTSASSPTKTTTERNKSTNSGDHWHIGKMLPGLLVIVVSLMEMFSGLAWGILGLWNGPSGVLLWS